MAEEGEATTGARGTQGLPIPFASRSMKMEWLRRGHSSGSASFGSDLRLMLEGRLTDMGRRPANVEAFVDSGEEDQAPMLRLSDADGVFLEVDLATTRPDEAEEPELEPEEDDSRRAASTDPEATVTRLAD